MAMMIRNRLAAGVEYQRLAAPELGGVVLGAGLSLELGLPLLLVRKQSKEYGTTKQIEGRWVAGERIALVEDIVTSGGAAIMAAAALRDAGLIVEDLFCVVDREEGGVAAAAAAGLSLRPLFTSSELGVGQLR
jgi:orotate phosphoribosyltransferase